MTNDKKWLIMTYYCPTHGSLDRSEPIEITINDLNKAKKRFTKNQTNWNHPKIPEFLRNVLPRFPTRKNRDRFIKSIMSSANNL